MRLLPALLRRLTAPAALVFALFFATAPARALDPRKAITQYAHQVWKTDAGLPQNSIQAILQTTRLLAEEVDLDELLEATLDHLDDPSAAAISLVNAGLEGFVRAAALEMPAGVRVNIVSPPWVRETLSRMGLEPAPGMPAVSVAAAYADSVEGTMTGKVIDARTFAA